jgi:DNA (cytosine-5)-methyltransferase 1
MGYYRAGFDVVGVDIEPQPHYPFEFVQGDAIEYIREHGREFDVIHASPPCQRFSVMTKRWGDDMTESHINLIPVTRAALRRTGKPYIIENVEGARAELVRPIMLCGTMFGLELDDGSQLRRHRYFECWGFEPGLTSPCWHNNTQSVLVAGHTGGRSTRDGRIFHTVGDRKAVMGIDWMTNQELTQAIPPAYTEWIGKQLLVQLALPV